MTSMIEEQTAAAASPGSQEQRAEKKPNTAPQKPRVASTKGKSGKKATPGKKAAKGPAGAKAPKPARPSKPETNSGAAREGSKAATVLGLAQRPKGATLAEIMEATGWQAHSVRGFISGTMGKKMGLKVESTKREDGTRVYSISK